MKSKKILALALASVMCLSAACSSAADSSGADGNASDETRAASSGDRYEIVFDNSKDQLFELMITRDDYSNFETDGYSVNTTYILQYNKQSDIGADSYELSRIECHYDADGNNIGETYSLKDDHVEGSFSEEEFRTILDNVLTITEDWYVFDETGEMSVTPDTPVTSTTRLDFSDPRNDDIEPLVHICYTYDDTELFNYLESIPMPDPEER